jgi:His Kinase A (phospho-acceptor) domain
MTICSRVFPNPLLRPVCDVSRLPSTEEILASAAHELLLPLSHIKGFVSSLRRTDAKWDEKTRREFIAEIDLEADRLAELIQELCSRGVPRSVGWPRGRGTSATGQSWTCCRFARLSSSAAHSIECAMYWEPDRCG